MDWFDVAVDCEGWLTGNEALFLYKTAKKCDKGCIVEIGSYKGRSTMFLAAGSRAGHFAKVYSIDTHDGGRWLREKTNLGDINTYDEFIANLEAASLREYVNVIVNDSVVVAKSWIGDIGLLFVDGDHFYESTLNDLLEWLPHVIKGGVVVIHDAIARGIHPAHPGPARVASEYLIKGDLFHHHNIVDTIVWSLKK